MSVPRAAVAAASMLFCGVAHANGRLPSAGQIAVSGDTVLVRTTFGVVLSADHGESWRYVCEKAMHYGGAQDPPYALARGGHVLLVSSLGFVRGVASGEHFDATLPLRGGRDLAASPEDTLVLTSNFASESDAGYAFASALWRADAEGAGLAAVSTLPGDVLFETVEHVPGDPTRIVLSGAGHGDGQPDRAALFVSTDSGAHFERTAVPLERGEISVYVAGISASRVFVRTAGGAATPGRLLVAELTAPAALREVLRFTGPMLGFALDAVGNPTVGGTSDGVWRATPDLHFERVSSTRVRCLASAPGELWACPDDAALAMVSTDGGRTFAPRLRLDQVGQLAPGDEVRAACTDELARLRAEYAFERKTAPEPEHWPYWAAGFGAVVLGLVAALALWLRRRSRRFPAAR